MRSQSTVFITGMGLLTPLGEDVQEVGARLLKGESAIQSHSHYLPSRGGAMIENYDPDKRIRPKRILKMMNRATTYALIAAQNAWQDSGLAQNEIAPERFALYTGTGESEMKPELFFPALEGTLDEQGQLDLADFASEGLERLDPYAGLISLGNNALCYISIAHNIKGPSNNYVKSGVSSSQAIGEALRCIRYGYADAALVVGVDCLVDPWAYSAYDSIDYLCKETQDVARRMCPFDKKRNGFMPGEGAGALILESEQSATARRARVYGRVLGYGEATDTYSMTTVPIDGGKLPLAIEEALRDGMIEPEDLDLIISHGNATLSGDLSEAQGIARAAQGLLCNTPVTATKPYSGHLGAASGVIETIFALLMIQQRTIAPIANLTQPDEGCSLNFVMERPVEKQVSYFIDIARSIGGQNSVVLVAPST
jgi:3-oxoacyl-[acyl-carrier-protein] synthase II